MHLNEIRHATSIVGECWGEGLKLPPIETMFSSIDWFNALLVVVAAITLRHNEQVVAMRSGNSPLIRT